MRSDEKEVEAQNPQSLMDFSSSPGCNPGRPCHHHHHCRQNHHILYHHHHHFHHHHPHCPLHSSQFTPIIHPQFNPSLAFSPFSPQHSNFLVSNFHQHANVADKQIPEGVQKGLEEVEVVEEEDYVYVLTDEWKEFFSKSEAKRRLAKKQPKKKGN